MQGVGYGMCLPSSCSLEDLRNILFDISWDNQARFTQVKKGTVQFVHLILKTIVFSLKGLLHPVQLLLKRRGRSN